MLNNQKINFVFFYIEKDENKFNSNNVLHNQNREQISFFISSIKKNHPDCNIIQCSDQTTEKFDDTNRIFRMKVDQNKIMEARIKIYSELNLNTTSIFLDTDMLLVQKIPFELFIKKADVFLLKRSFNINSKVPVTFRGQRYENHSTGTLGNLYPFLGCFVVTKNTKFWKECYDIYKKLDNNYKFWFGDQEVLKEIVKRNLYDFAFLSEADFACPPQFIRDSKNPFLIHFKGKKPKDMIESYYNQIYNTTK